MASPPSKYEEWFSVIIGVVRRYDLPAFKKFNLVHDGYLLIMSSHLCFVPCFQVVYVDNLLAPN